MKTPSAIDRMLAQFREVIEALEAPNSDRSELDEPYDDVYAVYNALMWVRHDYVQDDRLQPYIDDVTAMLNERNSK